jgi:hypothetical protein
LDRLKVQKQSGHEGQKRGVAGQGFVPVPYSALIGTKNDAQTWAIGVQAALPISTWREGAPVFANQAFWVRFEQEEIGQFPSFDRTHVFFAIHLRSAVHRAATSDGLTIETLANEENLGFSITEF